MSQTWLCFYSGTLMQPMYAGLFKGLSETELDYILSSFSAKQCFPNEGLVDLLSKYMAKPAYAVECCGANVKQSSQDSRIWLILMPSSHPNLGDGNRVRL
jgi:hypothetical protein